MKRPSLPRRVVSFVASASALSFALFLGVAGCDGGSGGGTGGSGGGTGGTGGGTGGTGGGTGGSGQLCDDGFVPGGACSAGQPDCSYMVDDCGGGTHLTCGPDDLWVEAPDGPRCCQLGDDPGPYPDCPTDPPEADASCEVCLGAQPCTYTVDIGCGDQELLAECDADTAKWVVTEPVCQP